MSDIVIAGIIAAAASILSAYITSKAQQRAQQKENPGDSANKDIAQFLLEQLIEASQDIHDKEEMIDLMSEQLGEYEGENQP